MIFNLACFNFNQMRSSFFVCAFNKIKILLVAMIVVIPIIALADSISNDSKNLAYCEGIYVYAAHVAQITQKEGVAKNLIYRDSNVVTANLFLNMDSSGVISANKIKQFREAQNNIKSNFDQDPVKVFNEVSKCDLSTREAIKKARGADKKMDGYTFEEFQRILLEKLLGSMGIK